MNKRVIIDIRDSFSFSIKSVTSSINIEASELVCNYEQYLNKNDEYLLYCDFGHMSEKVATFLRDKGYKCASVDGGFNAYMKR